MAFELWPHQKRGIHDVLAALNSGKRRICLTSPTGGGKSAVLSEIIKDRVFHGQRCVLYSNRKLLTEQLMKQLGRDGISFGVNAAEYEEHANESAPVQLCSIQTDNSRVLKRRSKAGFGNDEVGRRQFPLSPAELVVVDEAHLVKAETAQAILGEYHDSGAALLGVTATPLGISHIYDDLIVAGNNSELRGCGALLPAHVYACPEIDTSKIERVRSQGGEFSLADIRKHCWTQAIYGHVSNSLKKNNPDMRPFLLFAPGVEESVGFDKHLNSIGIKVAHVDGEDCIVNGERYKSSRDVRRQIIDDVKSGDIFGVTNRFVLREAVDIPELYMLVLACPIGSLLSYVQVVGRVLRSHDSLSSVAINDHGGCLDSETEILTKDGWKGRLQISDDDLVAGYDRNTGEISWQPILHRHDRECGPNESFYSINSRCCDIRVTGNHKMLAATRKGGSYNFYWPDGYELIRADEICEKNGRFRSPVSGQQFSAGSDLSDDQIRFIGWFLTDGCRSLRSNGIREDVSVSQSEHQTQINDLRKCLVGCGFDFTENRSNQITGFNKTSDSIKFSIPKGTSKGRPRSGWWKLRDYLDKSFSPLLETLDDRQFSILLHAIHLGDGAKDRGDGSYKIFTGLKIFADRLQSMCVRRGWKCNIQTRKPNGRTSQKHNLYTLNIQRVNFTSMHGSASSLVGNVAAFSKSPASGERVWCVANPLETIVTRRNGKVAIIGNSYWRHGSPNADRDDLWREYFHDPDGETLPTDVRMEELRTSKEECPLCCPSCGSVQLMPKTGRCYKCHADLRGKRSRFVIQREGNLVEVTGLPVKPRREVKTKDMQDAWSRAFWAAKRPGGKLENHSFAQLRGMIASGHFRGFEKLRGQFPGEGTKFTPKESAGWFRRVKDVPMFELHQ